MLQWDPEWEYRVWPSWGTAYSFSWEELPTLLADPVAAGCLDLNAQRALREGILVNDPGPMEFFSGAFGNGVFAYQPHPGRAWIGWKVFNKEATVTKALGMTSAEHCNVAFLELRGDAGLRFLGEGRKKPREYPVSITMEHVDAAGDCLYWLLDRAPSKSPVKGLETLSPIAEGFGLTLEEVDHVDDSMLAEVREWFGDPERMVWFRVTGGRLKAGWQLAMMYYAALHLRMLAGKRMRSMHLVAQIEGRIGHRVNWGKR